MINFLIESGATICEEFILFTVIEHICGKKYSGIKQISLKFLFSVIVAAFIIFLNNTVSLFSFVTLIIGSIIPAMTAKLFSKGKIVELLSVCITYFLIITIVDFTLAFAIEYLVIPDFVIKIMTPQSVERLAYICLSKTLLTITCILFVRFANLHIDTISPKILLFLDFTSVIYYVCLNTVIGCILSNEIATVKKSITIALFFMVIVLVSTVIILQRYSKNSQQKIRYEMAEYQNHILENNYLSLNEMYKINAHNMHDYRNNILLLQNLLENNDFSHAQDYINELFNNLNSNRLVVTYTGVEIVDAVLNVKKNEADKHNIKMDIRASYPNNCQISKTDICAILGNLIDNAIEACDKITDEEKRNIIVKISYTDNIVIFRIENSIAYNPFDKSKNLETTKVNKKLHGLGLSIVKKALDNYSGDIRQSVNEDVFTTEVILYTNISKNKV